MPTRKLSRPARVARWLRAPAGQKLTHRLPALTVFSTGAYISYWHIVEVVSAGHERSDSALLYPVIIDMTIVVAARYLSRAKTRTGKAFAAVGFLTGAAYTLYCNLLASTPTLPGYILGVAPGVMVILTAGSLHWGEMKPRPKVKAPVHTPTLKAPVTASVNGHKAPSTMEAPSHATT